MLTTLDEVKQELTVEDFKTNKTKVVYDEAQIMRAIKTASDRLQRHAWLLEYFEPWVETRYYDALPMASGGPFQGSKLWLDRAILSLDTMTIDGNAQTDLYTGPKGDRPHIQIRTTSASYFSLAANDPFDAVEVDGVWGWHDQPSLGWSTFTGLEGSLNASETDIVTTVDPSGPDDDYNEPALSPGHIIRINSEYMLVRALSGSGPYTISVNRGVNGSTKASHDLGASIDVWQVTETIKQAATKWAMLLYKRRGHTETKRVEGLTEITYPKDMPPEVWEIIKTGGYVKVNDLSIGR